MMKLSSSLAILLSLVSSHVAAYRPDVKPDQGRRRKTARGLKKSDKGGDMKDHSSSSGKGTKKGGNGMKGCTTRVLLIQADDLVAGAAVNEDGVLVGFNFPVYDYETNELVGTYIDAASFRSEDDCVFSGSFNFDQTEDDAYASQVSISGTCSGLENAITGGTGSYIGASGVQAVADVDDDADEDVIYTSLFFCGN